MEINKEIQSKKKEHFEENNNNELMLKMNKSLPFFRQNLNEKANSSKIKVRNHDYIYVPNKKDNIEKIDFRNFLEKKEEKVELPKIQKKIKENLLFRKSEAEEKRKTEENRMKFLELLKTKQNRGPANFNDKIKQASLDLLDNNGRNIALGETLNFNDEKRKQSLEMISTMTFEDISQKLLESKNKMTRDLHILKEMKLARDVDLTKANLSNFRVSQREMMMNFIKRKKREYNNMNFEYNDKILNEKISQKFQKTVYLIMDKLSSLKLSIDEVNFIFSFFINQIIFLRCFPKKYSQKNLLKDL